MELYEIRLQTCRECLGENHWTNALILDGIGGAYKNMKNYDNALQNYKNSL